MLSSVSDFVSDLDEALEVKVHVTILLFIMFLWGNIVNLQIC